MIWLILKIKLIKIIITQVFFRIMKVLIDADTSIVTNHTDFINADDPTYVYSYHGEFNEKFFTDPFYFSYQPYLKTQKDNLIKLKSFLDNQDLKLEELWLTIFRNDAGNLSTRFLIKTNTNEDGITVYWRKYLSYSSSRSQNDVYLINNEEALKYRSKKNIRVQLKRFLVESSVWYGSLFLQSFVF